MSKDVKKIQKIEIVLAIVLSICTLFRLTVYKYFTVFLLVTTAVFVFFKVKKNLIIKYDKRKVEKTMILFGILYIALYYMIGLYSGFYRQSNYLSFNSIFMYIIPITIIIIASEVIRHKLLVNKKTKSKVLLVIIGTLIDISIYLDMYGLRTLDGFLALVGFVSFAAIANNILYTYLSSRYGMKCIIYYRLLTTLYYYLIPFTPDVYIYFRTFIRMLYPLLIYYYLEKNINKDKAQELKSDYRGQIISLIVGSIIITIIIGLISCKFLYGILVVGSDSMTGSLDKGDLIFFKSEKSNIKEGDVIVFQYEDIRIVHRVTSIKNINKEFRYYTKGDANPLPDPGYVVKDRIVGKVLFRIRFVGKPTLALRNMFNKEG